MPDIGTGISAGIGLLGQSSSRSSANKMADAERQAAMMGADASVLKPVGIKTGVGSTTFGYETLPSGVQRLSSAEYSLDPRLRGLQDVQYGYAPELLQGAYGLFEAQRAPSEQFANRLYGLAGDIIPQTADLGTRAQEIAAERFALMDPQRQREEQRLGSGVFARGRQGLQVSGQGQPDLFALAKAREEQNAAITSQARDQARAERLADIQLGTGLIPSAAQVGLTPYQTLQSAYAPYNTALAGITGIEDIGTGLFQTSVGLGGGSPAAGQILSSGFSNAAATQNAARQNQIAGLMGLGNKIADKWSPSSGSLPGYSQYQYSTQGPSGLSYADALAAQTLDF